MLHVLHISNDFGGTEVYRNLYQHLDNLGVKQTVFVPVNPRVQSRMGSHDFEFKTAGSTIIYSTSQKWYHRYLYDRKISGVVKDLVRLVDLEDISIVHTGTLCMTGAVAFEVSKKFNKPYIVSVRDTDINTYFKYMWWKRGYFYSILLKAHEVVFISPQYKKNCLEIHFKKAVADKIEAKTRVIPNGIDSYYLQNRKLVTKTLNKSINIVFAGGYKNVKNLLRLIKAIDVLKSKGYNVMLTAIGRSLPNRLVSKTYVELLEKEALGKDYILLVDYKQKEDLCKAYSKADIFALPSIHETFGLVYAEALSQGLPIVYTRGEGFDGFYRDGEVGYGIDALNVEDIANGIESAINNYSYLVQNVTKLSLNEDFDWNQIANRYCQLYDSILESRP
jgi:glycosyltransferase involved in cell wall biosynthesis